MKKHILLLAGIALSCNAFSQLGYGISSASYAYHYGGGGNILPANRVVEEEIFNYHEHKIAAATYNDPVALSYMWGNEAINSNADEIVLQLGIATHRSNGLNDVPPANLSLVVDVSGSMSGAPIEKSKEAMKELVKQLRESDYISLVLFGNSVAVPFKSQKVGDKVALLNAIDAIQINGSTDVHLGMKTGYEQVASTFLNNGSNRVIVFTDAMANTGMIDPQAILADTKIYVKDIDLTFIGIGMSFDQEFAREIKTNLRGHLHFVGDVREINKLFKDEVEQFLTAPHGKNAKLTIEIPNQLELVKFYGYNPTIKGNTIEVELDDLQGGLTQIFMLKFALKKNASSIDELKYELVFDNQQDNISVISGETAVIEVLNSKDNYVKLLNEEVKKNYSIVYMSSQFKQASIQFEKDQKQEKYYQTLNQVLATVDAEYESLDADLQYVYDLLSKQTSTNEKSEEVALADRF